MRRQAVDHVVMMGTMPSISPVVFLAACLAFSPGLALPTPAADEFTVRARVSSTDIDATYTTAPTRSTEPTGDAIDPVAVQEVPLTSTTDTTAPGATADRVVSQVVPTSGVQGVAMTWDGASSPDGLTPMVRTSTGGTWSSWEPLDVGDDAPDPGTPDAAHETRGGTAMLWVKDAEATQVSFSETSDVPSDLKLSLMSASDSSAVTAQPASYRAVGGSVTGGATSAGPRLAASAGSGAAPAIVTRAQWGAAAPVCGYAYASRLVGVVVHHTADPDYSSVAEAMQYLRADQQYHIAARGWCDIGYNFVVDKWGNVYEGRAGSLTSPVIGVHAGGFNTGTVGIAVLGNYTSTPMSSAAVESVARIAAWRLAAYGANPLATINYTTGGGENSRYPAGATVTLPVVFAHRDVAYTACPGDMGYQQMGQIRNLAQAAVDAYGTSRLGSNLVRASADPTVYLTTRTTKHRVTDVAMLGALAAAGPVGVVTQAQLDQLTTGTPLGRFVRDTAGTISLLDASTLHPAPTCDMLTQWRASCADYGGMALPDPLISVFASGAALTNSYRTPAGQRYVVAAGVKHEIADDQSLAASPWTPSGQTLVLSPSAGHDLPYGAPAVRTGIAVQDRQSGAVLLLDQPSGVAVPAPLSRASGLAAMMAARTLDPESMSQLSSRSTLSGAIRTSGGQRVALSQGGTVLLADNQLPADTGLSIGSLITDQLPAPQQAATLFARTSTDPTLFLLEGSARRPILSMTDAKALVGASSLTVAFTSDAALTSLTLGPTALGPGRLVKSPTGPEIYLVDGLHQLRFIPSFDIATSLGVATSWTTMPPDASAQYTRASTPVGRLVRCGTQARLGVDGATHALDSGLGLTGTAIPTLFDVTCANLPTGSSWLAPLLVRTDADPTLYLVEAGARRPIATMTTASALAAGTRLEVVRTTAAVLADLPIGTPVLAPGHLVKSASSPSIYLVDGTGRLVFLPSFALAAQAGLSTVWTSESEATLAAYEHATAPLSALVRCGAGGALAWGGALHPVNGALTAQGAPAISLTPLTCSNAAAGAAWTGPVFVRTAADPALYLLSGGQRRLVSTMSQAYALAGGQGVVVAVVAQVDLAAVPTGLPL